MLVPDFVSKKLKNARKVVKKGSKVQNFDVFSSISILKKVSSRLLGDFYMRRKVNS